MSSDLQFEVCPETGICSIYRGEAKIDLMPDEVAAISDAAGDADAVKAVLAESDGGFTAALTADELAQIGKTLS
ncbi:MAG: hypothetical protein ACYDBB_12815 [Armatimonadota bacterium]